MRRKRFDEEFTPQAAWLDLVNSQQWDGFGKLTDHLLNPGWVSRFLRYWQIRRTMLGRATAGAELAELRNALRKMTEKIASGKSLNLPELRTLNVLLKAPGYIQVVAKGEQIRTELRPFHPNWAWIRSQIAASFVDSLRRCPDRIKVCGNSGCRWAFYDSTKGNIRRWCNDRRCGNRDRVRRSRSRSNKLSKNRSSHSISIKE